MDDPEGGPVRAAGAKDSEAAGEDLELAWERERGESLRRLAGGLLRAGAGAGAAAMVEEASADFYPATSLFVCSFGEFDGIALC